MTYFVFVVSHHESEAKQEKKSIRKIAWNITLLLNIIRCECSVFYLVNLYFSCFSQNFFHLCICHQLKEEYLPESIMHMNAWCARLYFRIFLTAEWQTNKTESNLYEREIGFAMKVPLFVLFSIEIFSSHKSNRISMLIHLLWL